MPRASRPPPFAGLLTLAALSLVAALGWLLRPAPEAAAPVQRVLVLGNAEWPSVVLLREFLRGAQIGGRSLAAVQLELVGWVDEVQLRDDIRKLLPRIDRYDAIFAPSQTLARVAQIEVPQLPIVFDGVDDPVGLCLVDTLQRPGRNATGHMHHLDQIDLRMIQVLKDAFPRLRHMLVPVSADNDLVVPCHADNTAWARPRQACRAGERGVDDELDMLVHARRLHSFAGTLGVEMHFVLICGESDFARLPALALARPDTGIVVPWHQLFADAPKALATLIGAHRLPAIYPHHGFTEAGGLMSLEVQGDRRLGRESFRQLARVLGGARPAAMPVSTPRGWSLHLNVRTAADQGLQPALAVLRRADVLLQ